MSTAGGERTQPVGVLLMMLSALFACSGQFLWKLGAVHGWLPIAAGLGLYAIGALLMVAAYRHGSLSVLQPILGLSYVLSLAMGAWWLHEPVGAGRVVGVAAVLVGVALVATSDGPVAGAER